MIRYQKWMFFLLAVSIFAFISPSGASGANDSTAPKPAAQGLPFIYIPEFTHDFGEVMEGTNLENDFTVKNTGNGVLNIDRVKTS